MKWRAIVGHSADQVEGLLEQDLKSVREWRLAGEDPATAPATPHLDRIMITCKLANVELELFVQAVRLSSSRNETAHHPPPKVEAYLKPDDTFDWVSFQAAMDTRKAAAEEAHANGDLDDEQLRVFLNVINGVTKMYYDVDPSTGAAVETRAAKDAREDARNSKNGKEQAAKQAARKAKKTGKSTSTPMPTPAAIPASLYYEGKWNEVPRWM